MKSVLIFISVLFCNSVFATPNMQESILGTVQVYDHVVEIDPLQCENQFRSKLNVNLTDPCSVSVTYNQRIVGSDPRTVFSGPGIPVNYKIYPAQDEPNKSVYVGLRMSAGSERVSYELYFLVYIDGRLSSDGLQYTNWEKVRPYLQKFINENVPNGKINLRIITEKPLPGDILVSPLVGVERSFKIDLSECKKGFNYTENSFNGPYTFCYGNVKKESPHPYLVSENENQVEDLFSKDIKLTARISATWEQFYIGETFSSPTLPDYQIKIPVEDLKWPQVKERYQALLNKTLQNQIAKTHGAYLLTDVQSGIPIQDKILGPVVAAEQTYPLNIDLCERQVLEKGEAENGISCDLVRYNHPSEVLYSFEYSENTTEIKMPAIFGENSTGTAIIKIKAMPGKIYLRFIIEDLDGKPVPKWGKNKDIYKWVNIKDYIAQALVKKPSYSFVVYKIK